MSWLVGCVWNTGGGDMPSVVRGRGMLGVVVVHELLLVGLLMTLVLFSSPLFHLVRSHTCVDCGNKEKASDYLAFFVHTIKYLG